MIKRLTLLTIILFTLVLLSYGVFDLFHNHLNNNPTRANITDSPDLVVNDVTYDSHNAEGFLTATLHSKTTTYFQPKDLMMFDQPNVFTYSDTSHKQTWHITADRGNSTKNNTVLKLAGHVEFHRIKTPDSPAMTIKTSAATLYPKLSQATSDQPVSIYQQGSTIQGNGMQANLKTGDYTLLSQTKGHYIPQPEA